MQLIKIGDFHYVNADNVCEFHIEGLDGACHLTFEFENYNIELTDSGDEASVKQAFTRMIKELASGKAVVEIVGDK